MESEHRDERDNILDRALEAYSSQEPPSGLEDRVLARVRAADARRRPALAHRLLVAAAVAAAIIAGFAVRGRLRPDLDRRTAGAHSAAATPAAESLSRDARRPAVAIKSEERAVTLAHPKPTRSARRALPKLEQFPTPRPLSREERGLLALAAKAPEEARRLAADQEQGTPQPIRIEPIQIEPLRIAGLSEEQ